MAHRFSEKYNYCVIEKQNRQRRFWPTVLKQPVALMKKWSSKQISTALKWTGERSRWHGIAGKRTLWVDAGRDIRYSSDVLSLPRNLETLPRSPPLFGFPYRIVVVEQLHKNIYSLMKLCNLSSTDLAHMLVARVLFKWVNAKKTLK